MPRAGRFPREAFSSCMGFQSARQCAPRLSLRSSAARVTLSAVRSILRSSFHSARDAGRRSRRAALILSISPRACSIPSFVRITEASFCMVSRRSSRRSRSGSVPSSGYVERTRPAAAAVSGVSASAAAYSAAFFPAIAPKTTVSVSALPARRFAPCSPPVTSPQA